MNGSSAELHHAAWHPADGQRHRPRPARPGHPSLAARSIWAV